MILAFKLRKSFKNHFWQPTSMNFQKFRIHDLLKRNGVVEKVGHTLDNSLFEKAEFIVTVFYFSRINDVNSRFTRFTRINNIKYFIIIILFFFQNSKFYIKKNITLKRTFVLPIKIR